MLAAASVPSAQLPLNIVNVLLYVLPPVLGYFVIAALAITPRTYILRITLWPIIALFAWRAAVSLDMSAGEHDLRFRNTLFTFLMLFIVTRTFDWILAKAPLVRHRPPANRSHSVIMDTLDLALALRGYGWNWAHKVYFPRETRPAGWRGFTWHTFLSAVGHALLCGVLHAALRWFSPMGHGSLSGGSIFHDALPFHVRYVRASIISACASVGIYAFIQVCYDTCTLAAVLVLGHDPMQWPPAFNAPWRATSLADLWGRRWHQFFRRTFLIQGGYPLSVLFGRTGMVVGTFISSGVLHHVAMMMLDDKLESWSIIVGFGMMAPGVLAEEALARWTGRKVGGIRGWVWTMTWLSLWGNLIIDGFARAGVFGGHLIFTEYIIPRAGGAAIKGLVTSFDGWLCTL